MLSTEEAFEAPPDPSQPRMKVAIDPERPAFWTRVEAGLRLDNTRSAPILLLDAQVQTAGEVAVLRMERETLPASSLDGALVVEGRRLLDDPGNGPREPRPPRWEFDGADGVAPLPLVRPGSSYVLHGSVHLTDTAGRRLRGVVRYVEVNDDLPLLTLAEQRVDPAPPGAHRDRPERPGWRPTHQARLVFRRSAPAASLSWSMPARAVELPDGPAIFPQGIAASLYPALLEQAKVASEVLVFDIEPPPLTLEEARKEAGISAGPYSYFAHARAWVFETRRDTLVVQAGGRRESHPGRLVKLVDWLSRAESVELLLFALAPEEDPRGLASFLRESGHSVNVAAQKGGGFRIAVEVTAANLFAVVQALGAKGLSIDGYAVRV